MGIAALLLYAVLRLHGNKLKPWASRWPHFLVVGAFSCAIPFSLIGYGERYIPSGLAGMINGSIPVFTAILAHFFTKDDKITKKNITGIFLGLLGLGFIFFPNWTNEHLESGIGILFLTLSSLSYAIGMVYARKYLRNLPNFVGPTWQLIMATALGFLFALLLEEPFYVRFISWEVLGAIFGLALIGTAFAFILYYQLIRMAGAFYLSLSALLYPIIAVLLGAIFLKETLTWNAYVGGLFILSGLGITTNIFSIRKGGKET